MLSEGPVIDVRNIGKRYEIYAAPRDRLKQLVIPAIYRMVLRTAKFFGYRAHRSAPSYFREFWALRDISFQVQKGEALGVVGHNGAGKSTLLQLICGTLNTTYGEVVVRGRISALLELGSGFNPEYTGKENVFLNGQILGLSHKEIEDRYGAIIGFADIGSFIDQPTKTYSSGMVVRLAFAVAVNVDPEILIVDEALAVGDTPFQVKCFAHLKELRKRGVSILFVSHSLSTVRTFCDRVLYLSHGQSIAIGPANEIARRYELDCLKEKFKPSEIEVESPALVDQVFEEGEGVLSRETLNYLECVRASFLEKAREGSQAVTIESFILADENGIPQESISPINHVVAYAMLRLNRNLAQDLHFSIQIRDRQGTPLMVLRDSAFEETVFGAKGDCIILSMRFSLPLQAGSYYCQVGASLFPPGEKYKDGLFNFDSAEVADLVEYAAYFSILPHGRHHIPVPVLNETIMKLALFKSEKS